jgi:hypothetical protein
MTMRKATLFDMHRYSNTDMKLSQTFIAHIFMRQSDPVTEDQASIHSDEEASIHRAEEVYARRRRQEQSNL